MYVLAERQQNYNISDAVSFIRRTGLAPNARLEAALSMDALEELAESGKPVLLNVRGTDLTGKVGHAILIQGWSNGEFEIADPLVGVYLQSPANLAPRLKGYGQAIVNLK